MSKNGSIKVIKSNKNNYDLEDGAEVLHIKKCITNSQDIFQELLLNVKWKKFKYTIYDKEVESPRLMNVVDINKIKKLPQLDALKNELEKRTERKYSYVLLNYYRDGKDYISYHSDRETKYDTSVALVSLGGTRKFVLKNINNSQINHQFILEDGDLMILNYEAIKTQFKHSIPKMAGTESRISITFRE